MGLPLACSGVLRRALDTRGDTLAVPPSLTRNAKAAQRLRRRALRGLRASKRPTAISADKAGCCTGCCGPAIAALKKSGRLPEGRASPQGHPAPAGAAPRPLGPSAPQPLA